MNDIVKRERFGRYLILDHLVDGGMAKICRARFLGEQADKVVAIKMVQSQFSKDENFKTMFMDEIKVTFGLLHPNVIQTYDYGMHQGQLFVAMEYCDGKNLKEYLDKLKERKFVFPVEISTYIISQACQGLYYAHTFRDKLTGVESNIIHRDISPHNIMLTYDGSVKIIDFGIAKSEKNSEATQVGTIKGKLSYLAPEYLEGLELDARYDQFAVGITLWEMLCSRKLFKENNSLAILKKIQECKIPVPSSINPNVPKELDEIVLKALSKDRTKRFENLDQMNRALMKFLYAKYPDFNGTDLSYFAQELFKDDIKADREKLFEFGRIDIKPFLEDLKKELEGNGPAKLTTESEDQPAPKREQVLDFGFETDNGPASTKSRKRVVGAKTNTSQAKNAVIKEENLLTQDKSLETSKMSTEKNKMAIHEVKKGSQTKSQNTNKTNTRILNVESLKNKQQSSLIKKIATFVIVIGGVGGFLFMQSQQTKKQVAQSTKDATIKNKKEVAPKVEVREPASTEEKATLALTHFDKQKMRVYIDGKKEEVDFSSSLKVPMNKDFYLRVQIEGKKHFIKLMRLTNSAIAEVEVPEMPNIPYGYIFTSSSCVQGEISFELWGEKRKNPIPMHESFGVALPLQIDEKGQAVPATYELGFKKEGDSVEKKIEVTIKREDETVDLCEKF